MRFFACVLLSRALRRGGISARFGFAAMLAAPPVADPAAVEIEVLGVQVRWRGPAGCPDAEAVKAALEQGDAEAAPDDARVSVDATIAATDDRRWSMQAEVASPTGRERRSWIADDCETITKLLVVIVGSALARAHEERSVGDPPAPAPIEPVPPPAVLPTLRAKIEPRIVATKPVPKKRVRTELALRITTGIEAGGLPNAGPGVAAGLVVARPRWRADAIAVWVLPRATSLTPGGPGARVQLAAGAVRGCVRLGDVVEVPLCAGIELGAVHGKATHVDKIGSDDVLWAAALLGPGVRVRVRRRIALVLDTTLAIPLGRPRFELTELGQVYRARTGARALFGIEFRVR
ncbi:MAG TPA: hypothetical protein VG755_31880 [Nannocystaceae bacterium]|nr:hypothetical protein [Nannocystaceae bacterium]